MYQNYIADHVNRFGQCSVSNADLLPDFKTGGLSVCLAIDPVIDRIDYTDFYSKTVAAVGASKSSNACIGFPILMSDSMLEDENYIFSYQLDYVGFSNAQVAKGCLLFQGNISNYKKGHKIFYDFKKTPLNPRVFISSKNTERVLFNLKNIDSGDFVIMPFFMFIANSTIKNFDCSGLFSVSADVHNSSDSFFQPSK